MRKFGTSIRKQIQEVGSQVVLGTLPRNRTIKLTISGLNRSATDVITTTDGSATCITTMQLQ
jgi:hypothetical protein